MKKIKAIRGGTWQESLETHGPRSRDGEDGGGDRRRRHQLKRLQHGQDQVPIRGDRWGPHPHGPTDQIGRPAPEAKGMIDTLSLLRQRFKRRAGDMKMATLATYFGLGQQRHM
ncbi:uncharacterized protein A4U43_C08F22040 [Asparagus officinalis]|nr:uncharacterized protein A4U43_C08F22040 [Asparagus officinalis]